MGFFSNTSEVSHLSSDANYILGDTILEVKEVSKSFNGRKIISNINFDIKDVIRTDKVTGQIVSLIGRSGIGKTVLFNILAGFIDSDSGDILLNGNKVRYGDVGVIPQNYILFNYYTVRKNLSLANSKGKFDENYIKFLIEKFELLDHLDKYPIQLSGGQKQRVSILQQVISGHNFILCDEPFSGLDYPTIQKVKEVMRHVADLDEKNTIIIISHDIESSLSISDSALIMTKKSPEDGATISKIIDLKSLGLAWRDLENDSKFYQLIKEIRDSL